MNIVKFKDLIRPDSELYNQHLKGKYAFLIHMKYAVPLELIHLSDYIRFERNLDELSSSEIPHWDIFEEQLQSYIDESATEQANSILRFQMQNKYVTDPDITTDEVKRFRAWLAENLLKFDSTETGEPKHELFSESLTRAFLYYAHNKYDETVKVLSEIQPTEPQTVLGFQDCGCHQTTPVITGWNIHSCNVLDIYREHIQTLVATTFQEIDFWSGLPNIFLQEFKTYIDHILRLNLPLQASTQNINVQDCACLPNTAQLSNQDILKRLSQSLQYIIDSEISGHKNYISSALKDWSTKLYDSMQWV